MSTEDMFYVDPFADFHNLLKGHLSGAFIPDGYNALLKLAEGLKEHDEAALLKIIHKVSRNRRVDLSASQTSITALKTLLAG